MCILLDKRYTIRIAISSGFLLCETISYCIEKHITWITNSFGYIIKSMTSRINPAFWFIFDVIINSSTADLVWNGNYIFCQSCCCRYKLKRRTRCCALLCCIIIQRHRFIILQSVKIICIYTICHFIIIISRITYHCPNLTRFFICHDAGTGTWL